MVSSPITSCQIDGEEVEALTDFIFMGSKITVDGEYSHEIKKTLSPWKKIYDRPRQHIKKQRHHLGNKGPSSQSYGFPVVVYGCESWTIKKAECRRTDAFKLWCRRKHLRVPWTSRRWWWTGKPGLLQSMGLFKSLLQHHSSKASILWHTAFFIVQLSTYLHDYWKNHSFD